jgi:hypothetical protein
MPLSALALAALLQIAPMAPSAAAPAAPAVVIPEAAPVIGRKGYLLQRQPFNPDQRVDQLRMPFAKRAHPMSPEAARALAAGRSVASSRKLRQPRQPQQKFVTNPLLSTCGIHGLERAGHLETPTTQPLSKMPKARLEKAVVRLVDGCPVPVLVAQNGPVR